MDALLPVRLEDKYGLERGRVYISGTQALVRLPLEQRRRDAAAGLHTAGYVTGYRGSPLGGLDQAFAQAARFIDAAGIRVQPGVNEDLAATAVWGTQQTAAFGGAKQDGVFALWYGKGPGVDRSGDAFKHGNLAGSAPHGGVLLLAGDDHTCKSSTTAHQSEFAFVDAMIPVLAPADSAEIIGFGLAGWAMSRASGCWVAMKLVTETVDSSATIDIDGWRDPVGLPASLLVPTGGLHLRWPDTPLAQEERLHRFKLPAASAFARANGLDRVIFGTLPAEAGGGDARLGIVTVGKAHLDVMQALAGFGVGPEEAKQLGVRVLKIGMAWPIDRAGARDFARGLQDIVVVEEKRGLVEGQLREALYGMADAPRVMGKTDPMGAPLFASHGDLDSAVVARGLQRFLAARAITAGSPLAQRITTARPSPIPTEASAIVRPAYFCSGCPHNTSTVVPDGSRALAGIGCHYLVQGMERQTQGHTHMGAEGANWIGLSPFVEAPHVFQNMGDGTYFHSGLLAIRAAIASGVNVTYKLLYNDAVAMTGGQAVDGALTVEAMVRQVLAEGAVRVIVVAQEPERFQPGALPNGVALRPRSELDVAQRELRAVPGVSVLVYDQVCATEKRRRKKRASGPAAPERRAYINDLVCEGCGDCSVKSNCLSVVPKETEFGTKRQIDQSSCNSDLSCVEGFCPSFITVAGLRPRRAAMVVPGGLLATLPDPAPPTLPAQGSYDILLAGTGGTGVVTVSALLGMAAHLAGRSARVLDMTGLAQKGGAVSSHVRLAADQGCVHAARIAAAGADLLLGCDLVVAAASDTMVRIRRGKTRAVVNGHAAITGDFTRHSTVFSFPQTALQRQITTALGGEAVVFSDTTRLAEALLGDAIGANLILLGSAWQAGLVPLPRKAIERAIELNGTAVAGNKAAFLWGRLAAHDPQAVADLAFPEDAADATRASSDLEATVRRRAQFLTSYQSARYARRYERAIRRVITAEAKLPGPATFAFAVANNLFKLMAYKDEYEVARLYADTDFVARVRKDFEGAPKIALHLAPPFLGRRDPVTGIPRKRAFGPWVFKAFAVLAPFKRLRGTPFDPFGYTAERRTERQLLADYQGLVDQLTASLAPHNRAAAVSLAELPGQIRGFGHIKARAIEAADQRRIDLLAAFHAAAPEPQPAPLDGAVAQKEHAE